MLPPDNESRRVQNSALTPEEMTREKEFLSSRLKEDLTSFKRGVLSALPALTIVHYSFLFSSGLTVSTDFAEQFQEVLEKEGVIDPRIGNKNVKAFGERDCLALRSLLWTCLNYPRTIEDLGQLVVATRDILKEGEILSSIHNPKRLWTKIPKVMEEEAFSPDENEDDHKPGKRGPRLKKLDEEVLEIIPSRLQFNKYEIKTLQKTGLKELADKKVSASEELASVYEDQIGEEGLPVAPNAFPMSLVKAFLFVYLVDKDPQILVSRFHFELDRLNYAGLKKALDVTVKRLSAFPEGTNLKELIEAVRDLHRF